MMVSPAAHMFQSKGAYPKFELREFKKYDWRRFVADDGRPKPIQFVFVHGGHEICLFVALKGEKDFIPMTDATGEQSYVVKDYEDFYEEARRIICEEPGWKKDAILIHRSPRKIFSGLSNATVMRPNVWTEIDSNHPRKKKKRLLS
ncbi:MAG: hypothetical protein ACOC80_10315 [Petrotogales bacterium]